MLSCVCQSKSLYQALQPGFYKHQCCLDLPHRLAHACESSISLEQQMLSSYKVIR